MPDTAQQTRETLSYLHYHPTGDTLNNAIYFCSLHTMLLLGHISTSHLNALLRFQIWPINP
ncbi:hypothetical protein FRC0190_01923 [Corynebacterium rouxii]|nr:hypothetical protein FRC0190_01923 [Corynebacterium rouxii]